MSSRYLYCGCGAVFHAETAAESFALHIASSGHPKLTTAEVDRYIDRICQVCLKARGVKAFGYYRIASDAISLYSWVCKRCIGEMVRVQSSAS